MESVLAIIPARGGSKGVENKNIKKLNGEPLISHTIKEAKKSKYISKIIVSTDSLEISDISKKYGAKVPFIRPKNLATDKSLTYDVVKHCVDFYKHQNQVFDIILLLQPTTPFRSVNQIDKAIEILSKEKDFNSIVSVVDVDGNHPHRMKIIKNGQLLNYIDQGFEDMSPRQSLPKVYIRSGSIYAIRYEAFLKEKSLVSSKCLPLVISHEESINVDTINDFNYCEFIFNK